MASGSRRIAGIRVLFGAAIVAALIAAGSMLHFAGEERSKEEALRQSLHSVRGAIDKFYADHARFPDALGDLVDKRYLRAVPIDPMTGSAQTWVLVAPSDDSPAGGRIFDVKSGAKGKTHDGVDFARL
jgi:general secretion pathway protein G